MTDKNECEINKISVWENSASLPQFPTLDGDIHTDVLIIGGGIAGILTAYFLHQNGVKYVLVDKGRICSGITHNTTAKITAQHGLIYHIIYQITAHEFMWTVIFIAEKSLNKEISCDIILIINQNIRSCY